MASGRRPRFAPRELALRTWCKERELPDVLRKLLRGVMDGARGDALAEYMGMPAAQVTALEEEFLSQAGTSVYEAAIEVLMAPGRTKSQHS